MNQNLRNVRISVQSEYFGCVHSRKGYDGLTELIDTVNFGDFVALEEFEFLFEHFVTEPNLDKNKYSTFTLTKLIIC